MDNVNLVLDTFAEYVFFAVPVAGTDLRLVVVWLIVAAVFFTVWLGFPNLWGFKHAIDLVRGKFDDKRDPGEVSHFQALATALSGTVGLGNIAGVAIAITIGGPGATFWMIVAGLLGMSLKMAECTLSTKYRHVHADGTVSGGPMYVMRDGLASIRLGGLGKVLAALFAVFAILGSLGGGNMFQSNQAAAQIANVAGSDIETLGLWVGLGFAVLVGLVIIGGIRSIANVTSKVVPAMAVVYLAACLVVILGNLTAVPAAFGQIIGGAFDPDGITGGIIGVLIMGFQRAAFSNEAGIGSAAIAHSAVKTDEPASEGFVALLEPFIDTVVICTMTALTIVITGVWTTGGDDGVALTSAAFKSVLPWFPYVLAICVVLFAFSTMLSWSYYGAKATGYLFGDNRHAENVYKVLFCVFTVVGALGASDSVLGFSDAAIFAMAVPNILCLYLLSGDLRREIKGYWSRVVKGEGAPDDDAEHQVARV
ncbi:alanine/glycine:cation symporter family protein [Myceligenerans salitolerans]|uniref:Alanine:cation symporter family protein n=1 Tax=Myceligenerans salitolerans TaxID=1230528 RepID=A0ABS3I3Q3_9MICO|nr:alanine/glycine:cation symporter family protein [Myceligenerans salitolerans]MBO0607617.1 alanine:cation symporter family protein [Myceligenerans salitolerans]